MKRKKFLLITLILVILLFLGFIFQNYSVFGSKLKEIEINQNKFKVEMVDSPEKLAKGLGERDKLCEKCGMLFEFPEKKRHSFWMKGMKFDLDIVWINGNEIVYIAKDVPYNSREIITPEIKADKVLEINAGLADKHGIKIGDKISF